MSGWNDGLSQDYDRKLFNWFAGRLGAAYTLRKVNMDEYTDVKALGDQIHFTLEPSELMHAFYVPAVVFDGPVRDVETAACNLFLMWQMEYPGFWPAIEVVGQPVETTLLNKALFRYVERTA